METGPVYWQPGNLSPEVQHESRNPGLGAHLHEALGGGVPVIGVAKTSFMGSAFAEVVRRNGSASPLFVTAAGVEPAVAAGWISQMSGPHRLPTLQRFTLDGVAEQGALVQESAHAFACRLNGLDSKVDVVRHADQGAGGTARLLVDGIAQTVATLVRRADPLRRPARFTFARTSDQARTGQRQRRTPRQAQAHWCTLPHSSSNKCTRRWLDSRLGCASTRAMSGGK